jgi:hypothetical protein
MFEPLEVGEVGDVKALKKEEPLEALLSQHSAK